MSVISNNTLAGSSGQGGAGGYEIERSLRFNKTEEAHLSKTFSSAGNQKTWTWSSWVKLSKSDYNNLFANLVNNGAGCHCYFISGKLNFTWDVYAGGVATVAKYRDFSAWYHFVIVQDSTQSTTTDRVKIYVNGVQQTLTGSYPALNADGKWMDGNPHFIARQTNNYHHGLDGYLADIHFIDGQALSATDFGELDDSKVWQPIKYAGTYGTNGFHLPFSDNSTAAALGTDTSGNGNTWTVNNLSVAAGAGNDSLVDSPVNGDSADDTGAGGEITGNYATLNPLGGTHTSLLTFSNGNLECNATASSGNSDKMAAQATIGVISGKFYWEASGMVNSLPGIAIDFSTNNSYVPAETIILNYSGTYYNNGSATAPSNAASWTSSDVIGVALNMDDKELTFYKNGVAQGTFTGLVNQEYFPSRYQDSSGSNSSSIFNFGQRSWAYAAPSGYKALCTANRSDPLIADGSTAFDTALYTGNGSTQTISGLNFSPDLVWIKVRDSIRSHFWFDTVRGAEKYLLSDTTGAEVTDSTTLTSFLSTGFTVGSSADVNRSTSPIVAWAWDGGSSNTTIAAGGLNSSVYNTGRMWSTGASLPSGVTFDQAITNAFNGSRASTARTSTNAALITLTFSPALTVSSSIHIVAEDYAGVSFRYTATVGGTTHTLDAGQAGATFNLSGSLTEITIKSNSGGSRTYLEYIKIDGAELIDSNITLANVPTIASTVRANPSAGFSIVKYNGVGNATVAHGLNAAPEFFFGRNLDDTSGGLDWIIYHKSIGNTGRLKFNSNATSVHSSFFQDTTPTSSVITIGTSNDISKSGDDYILYCFSPVESYSAMGSYVGNGSADGPFVFLGFKPSLILYKRTDSTGYWRLMDNKRDSHNVAYRALFPNTSDSEATTPGSNQYDMDFLSNGFKLKTTLGSSNASGGTFVYVAWAESPFKTSRAR